MRISYLVLCAVLISVLSACCCNRKSSSPTPSENYNYTGSDYNGSYVWGGAMNMAFNELVESILTEPMQLATDDPEALETTEKLNNPVFTANDMDSASYYIKSGYGQKTVDAINKECRAKFPTKSIDDLKIQLGERDIISYAYFLKEIEYAVPFMEAKMEFMDTPVKGFKADAKSAENVRILSYESDDKFLIAIKLKDSTDQIFLAKGYPMENPESAVKDLRKHAPAANKADIILGDGMHNKDYFLAPMLHLDMNRQYQEMIGKKLKNSKFRDYEIAMMQEIIKFDMDEKGARVENEAIIAMVTSAAPNAYRPKSFIMDKPYWVMMKRYNSANPYFVLGVGNTELMKGLGK